MNPVDPPKPPERLPEHKLRKDVQFLAWLARRNKHQQYPLRFSFDGTERDGRDLKMGELDQDQLAHIAQEIEKRRHGQGSDIPDLIHKEMVASTPKLGQPDFTDLGEDLSLMLGQPEMLEMWARWQTPRQPGARGERPNDAPAKAALALMGMSGLTHAERACERLLIDPGLRDVFAGVEQAAHDLAQANGIPVAPLKPFTLSLYEGTIGRFPFLSGARIPDGLGSHKPSCNARELMLATNGAMFKALRELYPDAGFGQTLLIDGTLVPAWCEEKGTGSSDEMESHRRRTCPEAGSRAIYYGRTGKADIQPGSSVPANRLGSAKHVRGYYYVVLLDQLSGWPLVSTLVDASKDEAIQLIALLSDLYRFHPDIDVKRIVGDGAWDEDWAHATCELDYGIAPVFRNTLRAEPEPENDIAIPAGETQSREIVGYTHLGQLRHPSGSLLKFDGFERPSRAGLSPGEPCKGKIGTELYHNSHDQRSRQWRVRAVLPGTGPARRTGLKVRVDWRRLNEYPRYADATTPRMRRKYAMRQALMYRLRNQMEGYFSRVKTSLNLGGKDASRVRFQSVEVYETLLHLAELRLNSLSLAQERWRLTGVGAPPLPNGVLGPLPAQNQGGYKAARGYQRTSGDWSTGTVPWRLRAGQHAPPPAPIHVPSAMPAAARAVRDPAANAAAAAAQAAQPVVATEPVVQSPIAEPVVASPAAEPVVVTRSRCVRCWRRPARQRHPRRLHGRPAGRMTHSPNTGLLTGNPAGLPMPAGELRSLLREVTVRVQARDSRAEREWLQGWRSDALLALQEDDLACLSELCVELARFEDWLRTTLPIPDELPDE